jgi:hydrogenase maturation protein HypF
MAGFNLCPICNDEYHDPLNRRFHAQPVACPKCGPEIWLEMRSSSSKERTASQDEALLLSQRLLADGQVGAIKGLGGFHLACNAENKKAVEILRTRKDRPAKPLAVMMPDLETVRNFCHLSPEEEKLLTSPQRPIVLLDRLPKSRLPDLIAPGQQTIGVMLPYTPLHYLLFSNEDRYPDAPYSVLVMTSANFRGNPILTENQEVRDKLSSIADFYLFHNRDIHIPCDDSVSRLHHQEPYPVRRSRGYTPQPLTTPFSSPPVFAAGAELKNTFALTRDERVFISQHIGDLKNFETLQAYEMSINHFETLFRIKPELLIYDLHPDYLSTRYVIDRAESDGLPALGVQHHHAHIAACLADNQYHGEEPVIGFSFDGVGLGTDNQIWGGEFLLADYQAYTRLGHLAYFPLPGGDLAVEEPWRTALSLLVLADLPLDDNLPPIAYAQELEGRLEGITPLEVVLKQIETRTNAPLTSSIGRLFDGISSLLGICHQISYEGQAAIELEAQADSKETGLYPIDLSPDLIYNPTSLIQGVVQDLKQTLPLPMISARFHNTLAQAILEIGSKIREDTGVNIIALSGGVWQNISLLTKTRLLLTNAGFEVFIHHQLPANDGGLSFGQAVIGQHHLSK